ncbi:WYL domain-containing protein [Kocuria nitroreducens]|uniref:WYL domain-containing protein n=1 Tax=Kocuria nitroreducens TaxID=3058914 RepID=UPI0036DC62D2
MSCPLGAWIAGHVRSGVAGAPAAVPAAVPPLLGRFRARRAPWPRSSRCCRGTCAAGASRRRRTRSPVARTGAQVATEVLAQLTLACRDHERFHYVDRRGRTSARLVEPQSLVLWDRWWYHVAWDADRAAWCRWRDDACTPRRVLCASCGDTP